MAERYYYIAENGNNLTFILVPYLNSLPFLILFSSFDVESSECYKHVRDYVQNGFPADSFYHDMYSDDEKVPKRLYQDYNSRTGKNDYDAFPRDVRDAARWRDGMVYADELYLQNLGRHGGQDWARMYKRKCKIVFLYEQQKAEEEKAAAANGSGSKGKGKKRKAEEKDDDSDRECKNDFRDLPCCPKNGHTFIHYSDANDDEEDDDEENEEGEEGEGVKKASGLQTPSASAKADKPPHCTCLTALNSGYLMNYYCSEIEGGQSQSVMREKIFLMMESEVEKIPKVGVTLPPLFTPYKCNTLRLTKIYRLFSFYLFYLHSPSPMKDYPQ